MDCTASLPSCNSALFLVLLLPTKSWFIYLYVLNGFLWALHRSSRGGSTVSFYHCHVLKLPGDFPTLLSLHGADFRSFYSCPLFIGWQHHNFLHRDIFVLVTRPIKDVIYWLHGLMKISNYQYSVLHRHCSLTPYLVFLSICGTQDKFSVVIVRQFFSFVASFPSESFPLSVGKLWSRTRKLEDFSTEASC